MYDIYVYLTFNRRYYIVVTEIVNSRYLTLVLAAAIGSFGLSDALCILGSGLRAENYRQQI